MSYNKTPGSTRGDVLDNVKALNSSNLGFADLPFRVRRYIYLAADVVRFCPIDMNFERARIEYRRQYRGHMEIGHGHIVMDRTLGSTYYPETPVECYSPGIRSFNGKRRRNYGPAIDCYCPNIPTALFLISHAISDEVLSIFYAENRFTICRRGEFGLGPIAMLSDLAWRSLTSISVRMSSCSSIYAHECPPLELQVSEIHCSCRDTPAGCRTRLGKSMITEWSTIVEKLLALSLPSMLTLSLTFDVRNVETAHLVVKPLANLHSLKNCSIRLGSDVNKELRTIAHDAMSGLVNQEPAASLSQQQTYLPDEILTRVLFYSGLVVPYDLRVCADGRLLTEACCRRCTPSLQDCACARAHAASSSTCVCWQFPTSLFLVNHKFREMAYAIFYQYNHFRILPEWKSSSINLGYRPGCPKWEASADISTFLTKLPSPALKHLRHLHWMITPSIEDYHAEGSDSDFSGVEGASESFSEDEFLTKWADALEFLSDNANLPRLNLELQFLPRKRTWPAKTCAHLAETNVTDCKIWDRMAQLMTEKSFTPRNLFIHICCYERRNPHCRGVRQASAIEKLVMGAGYDSAPNAGKNRKPLHCRFADSSRREKWYYAPNNDDVWPYVFH